MFQHCQLRVAFPNPQRPPDFLRDYHPAQLV